MYCITHYTSNFVIYKVKKYITVTTIDIKTKANSRTYKNSIEILGAHCFELMIIQYYIPNFIMNKIISYLDGSKEQELQEF